MLLIPYIILATLGVVLIQYAFSWCTTDTPSGRQTVSSYCTRVLVLFLFVFLCVCVCFVEPGEGPNHR